MIGAKRFVQECAADAPRPLHDATSSRCASYRTLMYMHGRLHGLVSRGNEVLEREATETVVRVPLLEYVEGDEDLEEEQKQEDPSRKLLCPLCNFRLRRTIWESWMRTTMTTRTWISTQMIG
eukprot:s2365_g14.t1